ncbi:MAG: S-adenosylmethionine decarboxylase [Methylococcaceae bacterium]|nr:S-adenosylmethionine decarboxylase [Methylococcaceae bacterium]
MAVQTLDSNNTNQHFGVHLTLEGYGACREKLADMNFILSWLSNVPAEIGMHKIAEPLVIEVGKQNPKDPGGISGFVLIAESHISIHTFPLRCFLTADVYTCQNDLDTKNIKSKFRDAFNLHEIEAQLIIRGLRYPQHNIHNGDSNAPSQHWVAAS